MQCLKPFTGPRRFIFKDPDSGRVITAKSRDELITLIVNYRKQNGYEEIQMLNTVLENYWCMLPENSGSCQPNRKLGRSIMQYLKGGMNLVIDMYYGKENITSKQVADKRAAICIKCPHNIFPEKTNFESWSDKVAEASTEGLKAEGHNLLGNCAICSCTLKAKVFWNGKNDLSREEQDSLPDFCWQKIK